MCIYIFIHQSGLIKKINWEEIRLSSSLTSMVLQIMLLAQSRVSVSGSSNQSPGQNAMLITHTIRKRKKHTYQNFSMMIITWNMIRDMWF